MSEETCAEILSLLDAGVLTMSEETRAEILSLLDSGVSLKTISLLLNVPVKTVVEMEEGENDH